MKTNPSTSARSQFVFVCTFAFLSIGSYAADGAAVEFEKFQGRVEVRIGGELFATYVYQDDTIPRPYWTNLRAPSGARVTRKYPPTDPDYADHPTMHPGIWMSFGDINGHDFWRNKARTRHLRFLSEPEGGSGSGSFAVEDAYETLDGELVCKATSTFTIRASEFGYFIDWQTTFYATDQEIVFGDQEEMGLGFRLAKPLSVKHGTGQIRNDTNGRDEAGTWGKTARWCDYSGTLGDRGTVVDQRQGIAVFPHPENFRPSWMHARDYGFLTANPFGRNAMTGGEKSAVRIQPGDSLTLRYGLLIYAVPLARTPPIEKAYQRYIDNDW